MTGVKCDGCGILNATQVARNGAYCVKCYK